MFGNVNRSGFGGYGYLSGTDLLSESPSAQAVRDILNSNPCRACYANEDFSSSQNAQCFSADEPLKMCRDEWDRWNHHSKTLVLRDRTGKSVISSLECDAL